MSKYKPPIPKKMELYTTESPYLTRQQWQPFIQDRIRAFKKALRENGSDQRLGMTDAMVKRRTETLLDSIAFIQKRYGDLPGFDPKVSNTLGYCWIHLNYIASQSYNKLARDSYITQAAALWILDQIAAMPGRIRDIHQYLPHDKDVSLERLHRKKRIGWVMNWQCALQKETMRLLLLPILIKKTFITILFLALLI